MIMDSIANIGYYTALHPGIAKAADFLKGLGAHPGNGTYELEGDRLYATIADMKTSPLEGRNFEAHCKYLDLHYILEGEEHMEYADIRHLSQKQGYDEENDVCLYEGGGSVLLCRPGDFYIAYPQDAHKPCGNGGVSPLRKVIVKILYQ